MKTQITSILLCVLLSSTLGHEYLSARHFAQQARLSKYLPQLREASPPQQCEWICDYPSSNSSGGLQIIVNETTSLVGIVNETAEVGLVIDINANLVGVFNGTSGAVIVVNINTGSGIYVAAGQSQLVWISAKESFEVYFTGLKSLQVIIDLKVGTSFDKSTITHVILEALGNLLVHLSSQLKLELEGNAALTILLQISSSLISVLKGPLEGILKLFGKGLIAIHGDILWLVTVLEGLGEFLGEVIGGLAALLNAKVELDLALLLRAANGIDFFVNLLLAIVARLDLSIVGSVLNDIEKLLSVVCKLGGSLSVGINGIVKVVHQIVALIAGHLDLDVLLNTLLEFSASSNGGIDISISAEGLRKVIEIQVSIHSSANLSGFITHTNNLLSGKLVVGRVNLSEIIELLVKGVVGLAGGVLQLVVTILLKLSPVINAELAISSFLLNLLEHLTSAVGVDLLKKVIPDLSIDVNVSIEQILKKVNIKTIISLLTGSGLEAVLKALPVIGSIVDELAKALTASSNGSLKLSAILKSSGASSIVAKLTAWVKSSLNIPGGSTKPTLPPITLPTLPSIGGIIGSSSGSNTSASGSTVSASGSNASASGSNASASGSAHWGLGWGHNENHGIHFGHDKSGHVHSHNIKPEEKKHH